MAEPAVKDEVTEYHGPDATGAKKIYDSEIKSKKAKLDTIKGDMSEPYSRIKDECNFPRSVLNMMVSLDNMEDAKRDHHLLAIHEGMKAWGFHLPSDLVTRAQGADGDSPVPSGERSKPKLVTVPSDGTETDLADAADPE